MHPAAPNIKCFIFHGGNITHPARFPKQKDCVPAQVSDNQRNPVALFRLLFWLACRSFWGVRRACRFSGWPLPALRILSSPPAGRTPTRILALPHSWPHSNPSSWVCQRKKRPPVIGQSRWILINTIYSVELHYLARGQAPEIVAAASRRCMERHSAIASLKRY